MKKLYVLFLLLYVAFGANAQEVKRDDTIALDESNFKRERIHHYQDSISLKPLVLKLGALPSERRDMPKKIIPMYIRDTVSITLANLASGWTGDMEIADKVVGEYGLACFKRLFPELVSKLKMIYKKYHDAEKEGEWLSFFSISCYFGENGKVRSVQIDLNPVTYLELSKDEILELYHGLRGIDCSSLIKYYEFEEKNDCGDLFILVGSALFEGML